MTAARGLAEPDLSCAPGRKANTTSTFQARDLAHKGGTLYKDGTYGGESGEAGHIVFGPPLRDLPAGCGEAIFHLAAPGAELSNSGVLATVDVVITREGKVRAVATRHLTVKEFANTPGNRLAIPLTFRHAHAEALEVRVDWRGSHPIRVSHIELAHWNGVTSAPAIDKNATPAARPFVEWLEASLLRNLPRSAARAIAETEIPIEGDEWFWTDDNAKDLELFLLPGVWEQHLELGSALYRFVLEMSPGPFVFRRRAAGRVLVDNASPTGFLAHTALANFSGDLTRGEIGQSVRFHDGRTEHALRHVPGTISFSLGGKRYQRELGEGIQEVQISAQAEALRFEYSVPVTADDRDLGVLKVAYVQGSRAPFIELDLQLTARTRAVLDDVVITTAVKLDEARPVYRSAFAVSPTGAGQQLPRPVDGLGASARGPFSWLMALDEKGQAGFSYAVAIVPADPAQLATVESVGRTPDGLSQLRLSHELGRVDENRPGRASEKRLLISGGLYQTPHEYDAILRQLGSPRFDEVDLSISYDYGAELNGVAALLLAQSRATNAEKRLVDPDEVAKWFDDHLAAYRVNLGFPAGGRHPAVFGRGLAFAILGADLMYRATGQARYERAVEELVDLLLAFNEAHGRRGILACDQSGDTHMDCQAAGLLALGRAALMLPEGDRRRRTLTRLEEAWQRITIAETCPSSCAENCGDCEERLRPELTLPLSAGRSATDGLRWSYKAGLVLRAIDVTQQLIERGFRPSAGTSGRLPRFEQVARDHAMLCLRRRGAGIEALTSAVSAEGNSETQAWVAAGLTKIDRYITAGR